MANLIDWVNINDDSVEIVLRINRLCNQKCVFCFTDIDNQTSFDYLQITEAIDKIIGQYSWKDIFITLSWWEPTLHKDFFMIVDYIYSKWISLQIQTNWVFFSSKENINKIRAYDTVNYFVSFHSHIEKRYNILTQSHLYNQSVAGIKQLIQLSNESDNKVILNIVLNQLNYQNIDSYLIFLKEHFFLKKPVHVNISILSQVEKYPYYNKLLFKYSEIIDRINWVKKDIEGFITISSTFWWECDMPYCIWSRLFFFDKNTLETSDFSSFNNRIKNKECDMCSYNNHCKWLSKNYNTIFWSEELKAIIY